MSQIGQRTTADTAQQHIDDHNEVHRLHNQLDDDTASNGDIFQLVTGDWAQVTPTAAGISIIGHTHGDTKSVVQGDSPYQMEGDDFVVTVVPDAAGTVYVDLPVQPGDTLNEGYLIQLISGAGTCVVRSPSADINDAADGISPTVATTATFTVGGSLISLVSDGSSWWVVGNRGDVVYA